jgi:hypothetical protein
VSIILPEYHFYGFPLFASPVIDAHLVGGYGAVDTCGHHSFCRLLAEALLPFKD